MFKSKIDHLDFNPTWTIPPTILREDVLPEQRKDPGYLQKHNIRVLDQNGKAVDPRRVDWSRYPDQPFPYILRQEDGPANALGRIKFMFPNPFLVYLHDTPSRELFRTDRCAFSSGCIRLEKPYEFAERIMGNFLRWNEESIRSAVSDERTRTIHLDKPVPVILFYWTAGATINGEARFKADIYDRDRALIQALDSAP